MSVFPGSSGASAAGASVAGSSWGEGAALTAVANKQKAITPMARTWIKLNLAIFWVTRCVRYVKKEMVRE